MDPYETLTLEQQGAVCFVTIDNPPVNVMTPKLYQELVAVTEQLRRMRRSKLLSFKAPIRIFLSLISMFLRF